ncbi:MAG: cob(I)yrinic acid a,c-diamide adenosyltransferase [Oscillospiraceae bacterium]|nr:cob(I)yrinic acid a,c-diamide adenosyltransferase [Oscillospiraceae bacterium]
MVHIYCGNGKGKTTAALGLAIRMAGTGGSVHLYQFMKGNPSSELASLEKLGIKVRRLSENYGFSSGMTDEIRKKVTEEHNAMLDECIKDECDLMILDEIFSAVNKELADKEKALSVMYLLSHFKDIVLTGREPMQEFLDGADYITEMQCVRHPFEKGIKARKGIEY